MSVVSRPLPSELALGDMGRGDGALRKSFSVTSQPCVTQYLLHTNMSSNAS